LAVVALVVVQVLMEAMEAPRSLIRFRVPAVAVVAATHSREPMAATAVPAAAAVGHLARVTSQTVVQAFPAKAALVAAAISVITQAIQDAAVAAAVLAQQVATQVVVGQRPTEAQAAMVPRIQSAEAASLTVAVVVVVDTELAATRLAVQAAAVMAAMMPGLMPYPERQIQAAAAAAMVLPTAPTTAVAA
jgi:hypothetical protein